MTVSLFTFVELYSRALDTLAHLLDKGAAHAKATGASEAEMLGWRLIDDMLPLRFQAMVVCNFTRQWPARVAGLPVPEAVEGEPDLAGLLAAVAESKAYLAGLKPEQFAGRDDIPLHYAIMKGHLEPTLPSGQWLTVFATTNIHFHLTAAYAILRAHGAPIGKADMFAGGL